MMTRSLAEVAEANQGFVKALALRFAPAPGFADDIAQQVFLEFVAKADRWDLTEDVRPLLTVMTRNVARRFWRERMREKSPAMVALAEHIRELAEHEEVLPERAEEVAALRECLQKLPEKSRMLVRLHYYLGTKSVDIAQRLEMKADAVRRSLFRLRRRLRQCLEKTLSRV